MLRTTAMLALTSGTTAFFTAAFVPPRTALSSRMQAEAEPIAADLDDAIPSPPPPPPAFDVKTLPGISGPLGFFDPVGFSKDASEGKIRFYREVELKHCRVGMLAALGFPVAEQFHPLFGGDIDVPSYIAFQETPLETFWPVVVFAIAIPEIYSVFTFIDPAENQAGAQVNWEIRSDHVAGDFGFDPLGLKPTDPAELIEMQNKELNNGRLAMLAIAGMVVQEAVTS